MQRLLSETTRATLAERQRQARAAALLPAAVESGGAVRRVPAAVMRSSSGNYVGNPNASDILAGWSIVKGDTPSQFQANGTQARLYGFERHPVVYACIKLVSDLIAAVPWEVYRKVSGKETLTKGGAGDVVVLPESPAQKLLDAPFFSMSPHAMRQLMGVHWSLYGNWFAVIIRQGQTTAGTGDEKAPFRLLPGDNFTGDPVGLRLVHPERLLYVYLDAETEEPILYDWRDRYGYRHRTNALDMLHARDMTATDWIFGYPRAAAALLDIQTDNEASTYVRQVVHNDGTAGTIVMLEEMVSEDESRALKERYYQRNVARGERGRTSFMGGVKDVKQVGFTLKDLEFPDLRRVAREDICAAFGVDPRMVGVASATGSRSSLSGREALEARYRLIQETALPMMRTWESYLDTWLMPEYGDVYVRFNRIALAQLTQDETEVWTRTSAAMSAGGISREEFRRTTGYPDKMDDTDTLYVPTLVQIMPVADQFAAHEQGQALASAQTNALLQGPNTGEKGAEGEGNPGNKPNANKGDKVSTDGAVEEEPKRKKQNASGAENADQVSTKSNSTVSLTPAQCLALNGTARVITSEPGSTSGAEVLQPLEQRGTVLTGGDRKRIWAAKDAKARSLEQGMHVRCVARFAAERDTIDKLFAPHRHQRSMRAAPIPDPYYQDVLRQVQDLYRAKHGQLTQAWEDALTGVIGDAINDVGTEFSTAVGAVWNSKSAQVIRAIANRAEQLASYVGPTTADQITATMHTAFNAGMSMAETASLVRSTVFGDANVGYRAMTIARTESIGALNQGEHLAAQMSNVVATKEWLSQGDDRVRESHAELDGTEIPIDDVFDNGCAFPGDQEGAPEEVINCRCTLLYHGDSVGDIDEEHDDGEDDS